MASLTLCVVGDVGAFHDASVPMFEHVADVLADADIRFAQNERHYNEATVLPFFGFTEQVPPERAVALRAGGFDVLSFASNHCMDLSGPAMMDTIGVLRELGFTVIGAGRNLTEAREPALIERDGVTIAFLAYCSVLRENYQAEAHRAGAAPMRAYTLYDQIDYQPGTPPRIRTFPNQSDLEAVVSDVRRAKERAQIVAVSIHWGIHFVHGAVADYQKEVAHAVIDAGADVVLGSGDHMLKAVEVYKGKPIFYSTGTFALDLPVPVLEEFYKDSPDWRDSHDDSEWRFNDEDWADYPYPVACRNSMVVKCRIEDGNLVEAFFHPVMINRRAQPERLTARDPRFDAVVDYVREVTRLHRFTTDFHVDGDRVVIPLV